MKIFYCSESGRAVGRAGAVEFQDARYEFRSHAFASGYTR